MKITAIIQARLSSSRFPGKVLQTINGKSIMQIIHARLKKSKFIDQIIFAIPKSKNELKLKKHLLKNKFLIFEGNNNDVLDRYYKTAKKYKSEIILRITGDCPVIDPNIIDKMIKKFLENKYDCVLNYSPPTFPDGLDVAVFNQKLLFKAWKMSKTKFDREHVMPFIIRNSKFTKFNYRSDIDFSRERWTIDEPADLKVIRNIFNHFKKEINFSWKEVIKLRNNNPKLFESNKNILRDEGSKISTGAKLWKRANILIPGGSMLFSKKSELFLPGVWPSYFSKAKGSKVWDLDGKKFLDMSLMGVGTNILGYNNSQVDKKVIETVNKGNMSTLNCPEEVELAEKLIEIHPWADCAKFTRTGGEANAVAIRIARAATGKDKIAICGYHGWHDWYLSANLNKRDNLKEMLLPGLQPDGVPNKLKGLTLTFNYNDINSLKKIITNNKNLCAIKMEVSRNTAPKNNFLKKVRELANKHNLLLIFDECTSGFRQTFGGLHKHYGIDPDIAIFGKALGNGYAINAIIGKKEYMDFAKSSFISSTFWTERIGPTAALKTLEVMKKLKSWDIITRKGISVKKSIKKIAVKNNLKIKFNGLPALLSFNIVSKNSFKYKNLITQELLKKSILATNSIYFCTEHSKNDISKYLHYLEKAFNLISNCENEDRDINSLLENRLSQKGFSRLN